jgi:hypothetical protein
MCHASFSVVTLFYIAHLVSVTGLYRGITPLLLVEPCKRAAKFASNQYFKATLARIHPPETTQTAIIHNIICGTLAGAVEGTSGMHVFPFALAALIQISAGLVVAPFEYFKTRIQSGSFDVCF